MSENPTQYSVLDPRPRQGNFLAKGIRKMVGRSSKSAVVSSGLTDTGSNSDNSQFTNLKLNPKTDPSRIDFQAIPYDSVRNSKEPTKVKILPQRGPSVISLTSGSSSFTMQTSHKRQSGSSEDRSIADATNPIMAYPSPSLYPSRYHSNASSDSQIHCSESRDFYEGSANGSEVSFGSLDPKPFRSALQRSDRASQSNEELMIGSRAQSNIIREQRLSMPTLEVGAMGPPIPKYSKKASSEHSRYNPQRSPKEVNCSPTFSSVRREPGSSNGLHSFEVVSSNVNTIPPVEVVDALFKKLLSSRVFPQQSFQNISTKRKWELLLSENETNMDFDLKMLTMQFIPPINESKVSDTYTKVASKLSKKLSMSSIGKNFSASFTGEQSVSDSATLSAFSKKFKIKEGSPKWYVSRIMANKLTVKEYRKLSKKLESKSSSGIWTHGFQDAQGVTALTVILQRINKRSIKSNDDIIREQHICHCLKSLLSIDRVASVDDPFRALEIDDKSSVTSKSSFLKPELLVIDSIMHSLISPSSSTRLIVTELLVYLIHSSQFDYHQHILDGFTSLQDAMGEFVRYQPWLNVFETAIDQHFNLASSQRSTNEKKFKNYALTTLILINSIIQKSMYVNDRNHSRKEFSDSRLPIIFNKLEAMKDENISQQILEYETVENEDYSKVLNDDPPPNFTSVNENYTWGGVRSRTEMGFETHQAPTNLNIYSSTSNINSILKRLTRLETSKPPQDSQKIFTLLEAILDHTASNSNSNFDPDSVLCLSVERLMDRMETDEIARRAVMEAATLRKTIKRLTAAQQKSAQGLPLKFDERNFVDLTCSSKPQRNSRYSAQQPIYEDVVSLEETTQLKASDYVTKNSNSNGSRLGSPDPNLSDTNIHHDIDVSLEEIGSVSHQESQRSNSAPFTGAKSARVILELDDTEIRNSIACSIETNISAKRNTFSGSTATVRETSHLLKTNDTSSMNLNDHSQICPISNETNTAEIIKTLPDGIHTTKTEEASSMSISGLPPPPPPPPPPQLPGFLSLEGKETNEKEVNSEITPSCNPPPPPPPLPPMLGIGISQGLSSPPPPPPPLPLMLASLSAGSGSQSSMTPPPPPPLLPSLSFLSPQHSGEMSVSASPPPPPPLPSMSSEKQRLQQNDESTTSGSQELEKQNSENTLGSAEIEIRPKTKLKQMHWSKIDNIDKTFWSRVPNKEIIDELNSKGVFQELEKAFVAKSSVVKVKTKAHNISTHKCQKISILPRDLAQQFGINLHMFGSFTVEELMRKILQCDESITENVSVLEFFNSDALNEIPDSVARAFIPYSQDFTRPDMTPSKSSSNLERADQIFLGIFNMRSYWKSRSRALLIMQSFRKDSSDLLQKLDMVHRGASCIQQSENLRRVLALIRSVGNFLNDSSKQAKGFKIDILQRLKFMKDDTNSVTFLHYIERIVRNNFPEYGSFVDELSLLNHTQRIAIEQLEADCEEFKRNVLNVNTSMTKGNLSEIKKFHPEDEILKCIERSIDSAKQKVLLVETRKEKTISLYCDVMNYYGESPSDSNSKNSFFAKFSNFVMEFRKVHAENVQKEEDERMYERKKQMIERKEKILQERTNVGRHQGKRTRTKNVSGDSKVAHAGYTEYADDDDEVDDEDDEDDEVEEYQTARADKDSRTSESIDELLRRLKYRSPLPAGQKGRRNRRGNMFYESKSHDVIMTDDELGVRTDKISNEYEKVKSLKRRMTTRKNIDFSTQDENAEQYDVVMLRAQAMLSQLRSKTHERELRDINEKPVELETEKFG